LQPFLESFLRPPKITSILSRGDFSARCKLFKLVVGWSSRGLEKKKYGRLRTRHCGRHVVLYAIVLNILNCSSGSSSFVGARVGRTLWSDLELRTCSGEKRIGGVIFAGLSLDFSSASLRMARRLECQYWRSHWFDARDCGCQNSAWLSSRSWLVGRGFALGLASCCLGGGIWLLWR